MIHHKQNTLRTDNLPKKFGTLAPGFEYEYESGAGNNDIENKKRNCSCIVVFILLFNTYPYEFLKWLKLKHFELAKTRPGFRSASVCLSVI